MTMTKQIIKDYLTKDLFEELNLDNLSLEERIEFIEKFGQVIEEKVLNRIMIELPEDDQKTLDELMKKELENSDLIKDFLDKKMPNLEQIAEEEIANYKKILINRFGK